MDKLTQIDPRKAGEKRLQTKAAPGSKWSNRGIPLPVVHHSRIPLEVPTDLTDVIVAETVIVPKKNKAAVMKPRSTKVTKNFVHTENDAGAEDAVKPKRKRAGVNSCNPNEPVMSSGVDLTKCACYPASSCTMQDKDATASHHRCTLCKRHYFAICMPELEFNMEMTCRFCIVEKVSVIISNCALVLMLPNSVGCRCCTHFCQTNVSDN